MSDKVFSELPDHILLTDTQMLHVKATIDTNIEARLEAESRLAIAREALAIAVAALSVAEKALRAIEDLQTKETP